MEDRGTGGVISIGFCGPPASGKSTLSRAVAAALGWDRVAFGDHVRAEARRRGLSETREDLQDLGAHLVAEDARALCEAVLTQAGPWQGLPVVIDGIRHVDIVRTLRELISPGHLLLVYVALDDAIRTSRLTARQGIEELTLRQIDVHSTEVDVARFLFKTADLTVDGASPVADSTDAILDWVRQQALGRPSTA